MDIQHIVMVSLGYIVGVVFVVADNQSRFVDKWGWVFGFLIGILLLVIAFIFN